MLSLFTAMVTNAMNTALDGSKCKDISGKEVRVVKSKKYEVDSVVCVIFHKPGLSTHCGISMD